MPEHVPGAQEASRRNQIVPPLFDRLQRLGRTSRRALAHGALVSGLPVACLLSVVIVTCAYNTQATTPWLSRIYAGVGANGWRTWYTFLILVCVLSLIVGVGLIYFAMRMKFGQSYRLARSILHHTSVPTMIADEQFMQRVAGLEHRRPDGLLKPTTYAGSLEQRLQFGALYLSLLYSMSTGSGNRIGTLPRARWWLVDRSGILTTRVCLPLGGLSSCVMGGCPYGCVGSYLLGVPLSVFAINHSLSFAEYFGNLAAICDFLLAELTPGQGPAAGQS